MSATRVSPVRVAVLSVATVAVVAGVVGLIRPVVSAAPVPGETGFAAYVDVTATPTYPFETPLGPAQQDVLLSFIVAGADDPCAPTWGGYYTLDEAATELELDRRIAQLRLTGGNARVSFGGQANSELSVACTDPQALVAAYQSVVDRYELTAVDLDIEGAALDDAASLARRAEAITQVQDRVKADGGTLAVWLTLPVDTNGLTETGLQAARVMLDGGVDLAGINGMTMNFGATRDSGDAMSDAVIESATALHGQVQALLDAAGTSLGSTEAWSRVGITPMIGQNDTPGEVFDIGDAERVNTFARGVGVGLLSMWSANRDSTCKRPLPVVIAVVQTSCSGIDQEGISFASVLADKTSEVSASPAATESAPAERRSSSPVVVDDPATSPFPIWEPLAAYPAGSKVVWRKQVYEAKWWTTGMDPSVPVGSEYDMPWTLLGPVLPGDKPAPLPTVPSGTYMDWDVTEAYEAGSRVVIDDVPYEAKWWTQGQEPGVAVAGGSPWVLVTPAS
jgi:chitinase